MVCLHHDWGVTLCDHYAVGNIGNDPIFLTFCAQFSHINSFSFRFAALSSKTLTIPTQLIHICQFSHLTSIHSVDFSQDYPPTATDISTRVVYSLFSGTGNHPAYIHSRCCHWPPSAFSLTWRERSTVSDGLPLRDGRQDCPIVYWSAIRRHLLGTKEF